jgi:hypothetical protein
MLSTVGVRVERNERLAHRTKRDFAALQQADSAGTGTIRRHAQAPAWRNID